MINYFDFFSWKYCSLFSIYNFTSCIPIAKSIHLSILLPLSLFCSLILSPSLFFFPLCGSHAHSLVCSFVLSRLSLIYIYIVYIQFFFLLSMFHSFFLLHSNSHFSLFNNPVFFYPFLFYSIQSTSFLSIHSVNPFLSTTSIPFPSFFLSDLCTWKSKCRSKFASP